jgi:glycerophosphoryl diester phosphodiesterase
MEQSDALGADVLEMDLRAAGDGTLVIIHDETVDRTTDGSGRVDRMTLAKLKELDAGYRWTPDGGNTFPFRGQGVTIPTLEEVFRRFPDKRMNLEIKPSNPSLIEPLVALIRKYGKNDHVLVASFDDAMIAAFRRAYPEVATSAARGEAWDFYLLSLLRLEATCSAPAEALQLPERHGRLHILTPHLLAAAHRRNVQVHVWPVNETEDMKRLLRLQVDGIITGHPNRLLGLLGRQPRPAEAPASPGA